MSLEIFRLKIKTIQIAHYSTTCYLVNSSIIPLNGNSAFNPFFRSPFKCVDSKGAFQYDQSDTEFCSSKWDSIPEDIDVLITHTPPYGICDKTKSDEHAGCNKLRATVERKKPRLHVFGHIHEGRNLVVGNIITVSYTHLTLPTICSV